MRTLVFEPQGSAGTRNPTTTYIEKPSFPARIKDHAKASTVVHKSNTRTPTFSEQIKVEPSIAMVKDLLADNIDGHYLLL